MGATPHASDLDECGQRFMKVGLVSRAWAPSFKISETATSDAQAFEIHAAVRRLELCLRACRMLFCAGDALCSAEDGT